MQPTYVSAYKIPPENIRPHEYHIRFIVSDYSTEESQGARKILFHANIQLQLYKAIRYNGGYFVLKHTVKDCFFSQFVNSNFRMASTLFFHFDKHMLYIMLHIFFDDLIYSPNMM